MNSLYLTYNSFSVAYSLLRVSEGAKDDSKVQSIVIYYGDIPLKTKESAIVSVKCIEPRYKYRSKCGKIYPRIKHYKSVVNYVLDTIKHESIKIVYVFKDNSPIETTVIEKIRLQKTSCRIVLIEEGLGLYQTKPYRADSIIKTILKRVLFSYCGLSMYTFNRKPQGMNTQIDEIQCHYPEKLTETNCTVSLMKEQFDYHTATDILKIMFPEVEREITNYHPKYVFLTQPLMNVSDTIRDNYNTLISQILECISITDIIMIKKHPLDKHDYSFVTQNNVIVGSESINTVPFQLLYYCLNYPITVSFYSSTSIYVNKQRDFILYKLLKDEVINEIADGIAYVLRESNICNDLNELRIKIEEVKSHDA